MPIDVFPYQAEAAAIMASRDRFGLFDEMGVGKTATTIRALDIAKAMRIIIVCPAMLRENWRGEFAKFSTVTRRICKAKDIHDLVAWQKGRFDVLICSYEMLAKWSYRICEMGEIFDAIVADEYHYCKSSTARRTVALLGDECDGSGLIAYALHWWPLTGTPMANDPVDIYTFLRSVGVMPLDLAAFKRRYFNVRPRTYSTSQTPIESMVPELKTLIYNNAIRRTKDDVGLQLPPIFLTSFLIDGDTQAIRDLIASHPGLDLQIVRAVQQGGLSGLDAEFIATLRRLIGEAKAIPYGHQLVDEIKAGAGKRVVFGIHRSALTSVRDMLARNGVYAVLVNGDTPENQRQAAVKAFQEDERCRVFIGNIKAAGTGLTLTASSDIDILESDWSPAGNAQAIMRVHRIGQTRNVSARFPTLANSIDVVVNRVVAEKTASIAMLDAAGAMQAAPAAA
jgi:SWI/SNF-related matrix-associated actin-dependent regulator 1 of chromatin subfamily A